MTFPIATAEMDRRFWPKVDTTAGVLGCWRWLGATNGQNGYGQMRTQSVKLQAHRVAYELMVGPIPDGLQLDHLCRNPSCVNPAHLEPVTQAENNRRGIRANPASCPAGHAYSAENSYRGPSGKLQCRRCNRERSRSLRRRYGERRRPAPDADGAMWRTGTAAELREAK